MRGRVLSVLIDRDRRLGWPAFESSPPLTDTKKAGQFKRGPETFVPSGGVENQPSAPGLTLRFYVAATRARCLFRAHCPP
jgi:hypothetical protein